METLSENDNGQEQFEELDSTSHIEGYCSLFKNIMKKNISNISK